MGKGRYFVPFISTLFKFRAKVFLEKALKWPNIAMHNMWTLPFQALPRARKIN